MRLPRFDRVLGRVSKYDFEYRGKIGKICAPTRVSFFLYLIRSWIVLRKTKYPISYPLDRRHVFVVNGWTFSFSSSSFFRLRERTKYFSHDGMYIRSRKISLSILCDIRFVFFFSRKLFSYSNIVEFHPFAYTHFDVIIFLNFFPEERGGGEKREMGYL